MNIILLMARTVFWTLQVVEIAQDSGRPDRLITNRMDTGRML